MASTVLLLAAAAAAVPKPTARQLEWTEMEIAALIHFNMATTHNCSDPTAFSPNKLDTDQWVRSFQAFGAREAVLVAKHACGFCTWPSNATLPDGSRYPYSTAYSAWRGGTGDVVAPFVDSVTKAGLGESEHAHPLCRVPVAVAWSVYRSRLYCAECVCSLRLYWCG